MIKLISYSTDFRGNNKKWIINQEKYISLVSELIAAKNNMIEFNIKLHEDIDLVNYNNPIIHFGILESKYNNNKELYKNYDEILFKNIRNEFIAGGF